MGDGRVRSIARAGTIAAVLVLASLMPASVLAAKGSAIGCPAAGNPGGNPGLHDVEVMTVVAAVDRSVAQITAAFYDSIGTTAEAFYADRLAIATGLDKNGDGLLCFGVAWGEELNPKSHWATLYAGLLENPSETERFILLDNHMGTVKAA